MPKLKTVPRIFLLLGLVVCLYIHAEAQSATATLSGEVEDQNGAVVPGANVTIENVATRLKRQAKTNESGSFTVPLLPPGEYTVTVESQGFGPVQINKVVLNVGDQKALQIQLKAGDVKAEVQVISDAPLINESPAVGTVVDRQFVGNIPLNGRSFQSLITLTPGVVLAPAGTNLSQGQFSVNGQRAGANTFTVDGASANFGGSALAFGQLQTTGNLPSLTTLGTTQSLVSVDALQEFKIQTSTYAAEYGRQPGGQISIITRSGENQFHGSVFEYLRNDVLDANDWFANRAGQPKARERQNDFGGTFSGPIILPRFGEGGNQPAYNGRNRTFFFFSYEGLRLRQPQFSLTNVPTLALRQQAPTGTQPLVNAFPLPNGRDLGNGLAEFSASYSDPSSLDAASIRIDHTITAKLALFARYNRAPSQSVTRSAASILSQLNFNRLHTQTITVGATWSPTAKVANELRVNHSSNGAEIGLALDNFGGATPPPRSVLIPAQYDSSTSFGQFRFNFPGLTQPFGPIATIADKSVGSQSQFTITDNFSHSLGPHLIKFGVDYRRLTPVVNSSSYLIIGIFSSQQQVLTSQAALALIQSNIPMKPVVLNFSAYGQDAWKVSRRLTLDFGLRWDLNPAPTEATGHPPIALTQVNNLATTQLAPLGTKQWKTTYNNFAPRVGVAYQLSQRAGRETVLRGGFGLFYDSGNDTGAAFPNAFPYNSSRLAFSVLYPLSPSVVAPAPPPIQTGLTPPFPEFFANDPALKLPYTLHWNLALQRSAGKSQAITVSYVGAAGRRLLQATQFRLSAINPNFTLLDLTKNNASSDYDAFQAQFQRRLSRGLQLLASYTWAHALDDDSNSSSLRVAKRGNAVFDVRHVFAAASTYEIPAWGHNQFVRALAANWSLDTSVHAQSALPVDLTAATIINPVDGSSILVRPNVNPGVPFYIKDPTVPCGRRINAAAFSIPVAGQSGTFGRNQLRGCGAWQVDAALRRQFRLSEKVGLQFRAEAFNLLNHPNFGTIQTSLTAANFGQATNMLGRQLGGLNALYQLGGPRSFQFALKVLF